MKKVVKTIAAVIAAGAVLFAVSCKQNDDNGSGNTESTIPVDSATDAVATAKAAYINFSNATYDAASATVSGVSATDTAMNGGTKGDKDNWAAQQDVLSIAEASDGNKYLKIAVNDNSAYKWYTCLWTKTTTDWSSKVMTYRFYVSSEYAAADQSAYPNIKILYKGSDWGEQVFMDKAANDIKAGWHTFTVDFKAKTAALDGTTLDATQNVADFTKASDVKELDLAFYAVAALPETMKSGYLLWEYVSIADAK